MSQKLVPLFHCQLASVEVLSNLLLTLLLEKEQLVVCTAMPAGIKFSADRSKAMNAKAYLKAAMIQEYKISRGSVEFTVKLNLLLQCLQIFGGNSRLQMSYAEDGAPLSLTLEEEGVITQCQIAVLDVPASPLFEFRAASIVGRAVLKSSHLKDCFAELDVPGAEFVTIHMMPQAPYLRMSVKGNSTFCRVDFPSDTVASNDMFQEFECTQESKNTYSLAMVRPCIKALGKAVVTNVRINFEGMLSMQHVIPLSYSTGSDSVSQDSSNWVEFRICAHEEEAAARAEISSASAVD